MLYQPSHFNHVFSTELALNEGRVATQPDFSIALLTVAPVEMTIPDRLHHQFVAALLFFSLVCTINSSLSQPQGLPRVVISAGGPYIAKNTSIQHLYDQIDVPNTYVRQPLSLVFTNGSYTQPGFRWVRVLLSSGEIDRNIQAQNIDLGRLLVDENSFSTNSQVYLDMSGQLNAGKNQICIEGSGMPGSAFSWELRSIGAPTLSKRDPIATSPGNTITLSGLGFSLRKEENLVRVGTFSIPAEATTFRSITIRLPVGFPPGQYNLSVSIGKYTSNTQKIIVLPPPKQK